MQMQLEMIPLSEVRKRKTNAISIESVIPSNHVILDHPLLLLPSIFPSIRVFSNESALCIPQYKIKSSKGKDNLLVDLHNA